MVSDGLFSTISPPFDTPLILQGFWENPDDLRSFGAGSSPTAGANNPLIYKVIPKASDGLPMPYKHKDGEPTPADDASRCDRLSD